MKPRDAAFVVDHRRQLGGGAAASLAPRRDDDKPKKKRPHKLQQQQQQQQQPHQPEHYQPPPAAQLPSKAAKKQAKKRENKAKQQQQDAADLLRQDSVKSRNHKLVLAPASASSSSSSSSSSFSSSASSFSMSCSNFPSWGPKQKKKEKEEAKPALSAMTADRAVTDALHDEILEYTRYTKKTVDKMAVHIEQMIANVRASVLSLWPQSKVETFGSYSTGIWLPSSDVDLVILDVVDVNDSQMTARHLKELAKVLEKKKWVESLLVLDTAKVPVLKLVSAETSVPIDITFESAATHSGLLARDLIKRYADNMPELYPLAIVFKQLLRERDLNDAYTGGLSSYSVVLMIIHFSQLWRNGDSCFEAASIYASGSLPPAPSVLAAKNQALKVARIQAEASAGSSRSDSNAVEVSPSRTQTGSAGGSNLLKKSASLPLPAPTSSYAAIVARAKQKATDDSASAERRFSYAAVAAGIAKVSEKKKPVGPPSSYAAAVSAPPGSSSSAPKRKNIITTKKQPQDAHQLDAVSVSSSNADTEDSSSSCSHSSSTESDDESSKAQPKQPPVSLGEHTLMILEFFGIIFDYRKNGLSVRDGGYIYRLADNHRSHIGKPALVIEDPIHPDRNVSASSFAFSKVVALFEDSYYALKYFRASKFTPSALSCLLSTSGHTSHSSHSHGKVQAVRS
ncbi:DNA polymerase sigma [Phytophthora cinnamomi]|uniref:DNA polymerase sigma n=1 Tax=Phytophthora cinnamomi TaxID=4785 RepID=UPI00355A6020|nr:DNA polymerase sigma [Phytophthora cinnamomi]